MADITIDSAFSEIGRRVTGFTQGIGGRAREFGETARINSSIEERRKRIQGIYEQIGQAYCQRHHGDATAEFKGQVALVDSLNAEISSLQQQLMTVQTRRVCPICHREVNGDSRFCPYCGSDMAVSQPSISAGTTLCPNCGSPINAGDRFCMSCGQTIPAAPVQPTVPAQPVTPAQQQTAPMGAVLVTPPAAQAAKICPACGATNKPQSTFCMSCGHKLEG